MDKDNLYLETQKMLERQHKEVLDKLAELIPYADDTQISVLAHSLMRILEKLDAEIKLVSWTRTQEF